MDVATIIANIKSQALVGNTGAADDEDRILRYINKGYAKVYAAAAQTYPDYFREEQEVAVTNGKGTWTKPVLFPISVRDKNNGFRELDHVATEKNEESDGGLTATGNPCSWDYAAGGLTTYPANTTVLKVPYVPTPATLDASSMENDILIPSVYHEVIEWAALWTLAYDERDKMVGTELNLTKSNYDGLMQDLKLFLQSLKPKEGRRVRPW